MSNQNRRDRNGTDEIMMLLKEVYYIDMCESLKRAKKQIYRSAVKIMMYVYWNARNWIEEQEHTGRFQEGYGAHSVTLRSR